MPFVNEAVVESDIKANDFRYSYIVFGADKYLKKRLVEKLSTAVADKDDFFNFHQFDNDSSLQEVYDALEQYPMMSDKKCVILKDYDFEDADKEDFDRLVALLKENIETAVFILWFDFYEFEPKRNDRFKKLCAACEKNNGRTVDVNYRSTAELAKMLCDGAKKRGCTLSNANAVLMVETIGTEIETLKNELEKVCAFVNGGEITEKVVKDVCIRTIEQSVYNLSGQILSGNVSAAMKILDELFFMRVMPMIIFYSVAAVYVDMCRALGAKESKTPLSEVLKTFASSYNNKSFLLDRAARQLNRINKRQLLLSLDELMETDRRLKAFSADSREVLEEMIVKLSYIATEGKSID